VGFIAAADIDGAVNRDAVVGQRAIGNDELLRTAARRRRERRRRRLGINGQTAACAALQSAIAAVDANRIFPKVFTGLPLFILRSVERT
jgi:hypothetical protein